MAYTFKGGSHIEEYKNTAKCPIEPLPPPASVSIPLSQHIGAHCRPVVSVGDTVFRGQIIGEIQGGGLGCPTHASISGKVTAITARNNAQAIPIENIIIENDYKNTPDPSMVPFPKKLSDASADEIIETVRLAGISGMGGATFPTYAKIKSALGKVDRLIVNLAECEPFITANHRLMLENPAWIINGVKILLKAFGLREGDVAIEDNKPDAIEKMREVAGESKLINIRVLKTKYPQGDERQLIYALTGREMPTGKLPADVGCVVFNGETCAAIYAAFASGTPLIERIVTVDGDCIKTPKNILAPLGASYTDLISFCGGLIKTPKKIINGGPMMGAAQWDAEGPITKGTSSILVFSEDAEVKINLPEVCIHCGRCVRGCPMRLMPNYLASDSKAGRIAEAENMSIMSCVECGTCSYNCPAHIPIVQYIRAAKGAVMAKRAAERAAASAATEVKKS